MWISNQLGNTGVLIGEVLVDNTTAFPFNTNIDRYKPTNVTGEGAASFELNVTDPDFKFPQIWRTNFAVDHKLPGSITWTVEYLYNKDVNGVYYINANLPAAQAAYSRRRTRARAGRTIASTTRCPNVITNAYVIKNQDIGKSWNISTSLSKSHLPRHVASRRVQLRRIARTRSIPAPPPARPSRRTSTRSTPTTQGSATRGTRRGTGCSSPVPTRSSYFGFGTTTVSAFWEAALGRGSVGTNNASYVFGGDMNLDGNTDNDLIYVPRDISEMNFVAVHGQQRPRLHGAEQPTAFEAYIQQDPYLKDHRGQYAERGGVLLPDVQPDGPQSRPGRVQDLGGKRNTFQVRLDINNFGNLLNHHWGVAQRPVVPMSAANGAQLLTNGAADARADSVYRMAVVNNELVTKSFQTNTSLSTSNSDVYQVMFSFRFTFN